jgi:hypothetical protein
MYILKVLLLEQQNLWVKANLSPTGWFDGHNEYTEIN